MELGSKHVMHGRATKLGLTPRVPRAAQPFIGTFQSSVVAGLNAAAAALSVVRMKNAHGFTLIELMIGIAILAIILGLGVPSFMNTIERNRITTATNDVVMAMQMARSEAIKRRAEVTVCRRDAAGSACENGTDWAGGWLVLVTAPGEVLRVWNPAAGQTITGPNTGLIYRATGMANAEHCLRLALNTNERFVHVRATGRAESTTARPLPPILCP